MIRLRATLLLLTTCLAPVHADEGMWTFDNFPADWVEKAYGFRPDQRWLDHVRLSSVRIGLCSGAFVSADGLVQTNQHCVRTCVQQLSTDANDLAANGFYAREAKDELSCPDLEVNQLVDISDVTGRIRKATAGLDGEAFSKAMNAEKAAVARECSGDDAAVRCDVVDLYQGGLHHLYRYRRYQDARLVFAPEDGIAFFGGDPDNFEFPRYNLDVAFVRVYRDGKPLDTRTHHFRYAATDAQPEELTFMSGSPGITSRSETVADLEFWRDVILPRDIFRRSELRGVLLGFSAGGDGPARLAKDMVLEVENYLKRDKGRFAALVDPAIIRNRAAFEQALRARIKADPVLQSQYGAVWDTIVAARAYHRGLWDRHAYTEQGKGFTSELFDLARTLVRYAAESSKPDEARLKEFTAAAFPKVRQALLSTAPIKPALEKLTLAFSLMKLREVLGTDDPFIKKVLGNKSPKQVADELVEGTGLASIELRTSLLEGGQAAIDASTDPMIVFLRAIDSDLRAVRKDYETNVEGALVKAYGQLAELMVGLYGASRYPDATATPRLSYGSVAGYRQNGRTIEPTTTIAGLFGRATGADPYELPPRWLAARDALNPRQPFNFVTTNDGVGGNSGSPVINKAAEIVGIYFDGNMPSLGGYYGYDPAANRTVAVNVGAIREALSKVYRAERLVRELSN